MLAAILSHILCIWACQAVTTKKAISYSADRFCYENWGFQVKDYIGMFSSFILRFQVDLAQFGTCGASRVFIS